MGFIGMVSFSIDPSVRPDLGFFSLLLKDQTEILSLLIIILGLALTISTVDTLVNAISSLFVVDGKATFNLDKKNDYLKLSKYFILILSVIAFGIASKGFDILNSAISLLGKWYSILSPCKITTSLSLLLTEPLLLSVPIASLKICLLVVSYKYDPEVGSPERFLTGVPAIASA